MTRYQVELLNPVTGRWYPHGSSFRSMTSACLFAERMVPALDYRIMPVEVDEPVRRMVVDGQSVIATSGVSDDMIRDEIARRREAEANVRIEKAAAFVENMVYNQALRSEFGKEED